MPLNKADLSKTKKFEDGGAWLELRVELTKHDSDVLADLAQNYRIDADALTGNPSADRGIEFRSRMAETHRTLFGLLAVAWSIGDGQPTANDYDVLDVESGRWVDNCIDEIMTERAERAKGKGRTSKPRKPSPGSPAEEAPPTSSE